MKINYKITRLTLSLMTLTFGIATESFSQDAASTDVIELSPFSVSGEDDTGYRATSSLAGTRLKTELKDIAGAIQVVTQEFFDDTAATDANDLLVYTTNTEVGGLGGNFANPSDGASLNFRGNINNPIGQTRVRGLANADMARQFFITDIPFDSYNTD